MLLQWWDLWIVRVQPIDLGLHVVDLIANGLYLVGEVRIAMTRGVQFCRAIYAFSFSNNFSIVLYVIR